MMMKTYVFVAVNKDKWRKKRKNFCFLKTKYVKTLPKPSIHAGSWRFSLFRNLYRFFSVPQLYPNKFLVWQFCNAGFDIVCIYMGIYFRHAYRAMAKQLLNLMKICSAL